jgi:hypothetical protein
LILTSRITDPEKEFIERISGNIQHNDTRLDSYTGKNLHNNDYKESEKQILKTLKIWKIGDHQLATDLHMILICKEN